MTRPLRAMLGVALLSSQARSDSYPRQPAVDVEHYAFGLSLDDDSQRIAGRATITIRFALDGPAGFTLDLATRRADGRGMSVSTVSSGGSPVPFTHRADRLAITLVDPPRAGERRSFTVAYRGIPAGGLRFGANRHGERTVFSENWPDKARQWLPTIDHPSDKATSEFLVTAPARYQAVSNGLLVEETDLEGDRRLTHWKQSVPIASWLNALGVARFASRQAGTSRGIPFQTWLFPADRDAGIVAFEAQGRRAFEFFSDYIGPYPYEKVAAVQASGLDGGMEHAGAIFYGERAVDGRPTADLVAHEVAHQWFGDSVTERDWDDVWLSEGFATYFAALCTEHDSGTPAFVAELEQARDVVRSYEAANPGIAVLHVNLSDMARVTNPLVYKKGCWTLHMLRVLIGPDAFRAGIREYYRRFRDANASTDDFRRAMEEASGRELAWFFRQWLGRAGSPSLVGSWGYAPGARQVALDLAQVQPGDPYRLPLEIGIAEAGSASLKVEKVEMTGRTHHFQIPCESPPASVVLDPNTSALIGWRLDAR